MAFPWSPLDGLKSFISDRQSCARVTAHFRGWKHFPVSAGTGTNSSDSILDRQNRSAMAYSHSFMPGALLKNLKASHKVGAARKNPITGSELEPSTIRHNEITKKTNPMVKLYNFSQKQLEFLIVHTVL
jgi:hypothetical protein